MQSRYLDLLNIDINISNTDISVLMQISAFYIQISILNPLKPKRATIHLLLSVMRKNRIMKCCTEQCF